MASVEVELDQFRDEDIIQYCLELLTSKYTSESNKQKIINGVLKNKDISVNSNLDLNNLQNKMKFEYLISIFDKYTLEEIESKLP